MLQVQDAVQNQIKGLQMKLDELKTEHKCNETSSENVISSLTDKLAEVGAYDNLRCIRLKLRAKHALLYFLV